MGVKLLMLARTYELRTMGCGPPGGGCGLRALQLPPSPLIASPPPPLPPAFSSLAPVLRDHVRDETNPMGICASWASYADWPTGRSADWCWRYAEQDLRAKRTQWVLGQAGQTWLTGCLVNWLTGAVAAGTHIVRLCGGTSPQRQPWFLAPGSWFPPADKTNPMGI